MRKVLLGAAMAVLASAPIARAQNCNSAAPTRASLDYWAYLEKCGCWGASAPPRASLDYDRWVKTCFGGRTSSPSPAAEKSASPSPKPLRRYDLGAEPGPAPSTAAAPEAPALPSEPLSRAIPCVPIGEPTSTVALGATWWEIRCVGGAVSKSTDKRVYRSEAPPFQPQPKLCPMCWEVTPDLSGAVTSGNGHWMTFDKKTDSYYEVTTRFDKSTRLDAYNATTLARWYTVVHSDGRRSGIKPDQTSWSFSPGTCNYVASTGRTCTGCGDQRKCRD